MKRRHPRSSTHRRSDARAPRALGVVTDHAPRVRFVFGAAEMPIAVEEEGGHYYPIMLLFMDAPRDYAYQPHLVREVTPDHVAEAWRDFVAQLAAQGASPPDRVRTADEALAAALRAVGDDAPEVELGPTPEIEVFREAMQQDMAPEGVAPSYFHGHPLPVELVREFFAAAIAYRKDAPWEAIVAEDMIDLDIPGLGFEGAAASVITDEGYGGLQIFRDRTLFGPGFDPEDPVYANRMRHGTMAVMFYSRRQLPESLRDEVRRLPFAPTSGPIPALVVFDDKGRSRRLTPRDYMIAIAALKAVAGFVIDHRGLLEVREARVRTTVDATYVIAAGGQEIEVTLSHPGDDRSEIHGFGVGIEGEGPRPGSRSVHRLKVTLQGAKPPIWRRLEVPSTIALGDLHRVLQIAMGWEDEHLHVFNHGGREIGPPESGHYDERITELWAVLPGARGKMLYTYDFGDRWIHEIAVEDVTLADVEDPPPRCVDGRRAGPPEDCGGLGGLHRLLQRGPRRGEDDEDDGEGYDPAAFSVEAVNARLARAFAASASSSTTNQGRLS